MTTSGLPHQTNHCGVPTPFGGLGELGVARGHEARRRVEVPNRHPSELPDDMENRIEVAQVRRDELLRAQQQQVHPNDQSGAEAGGEALANTNGSRKRKHEEPDCA